MELYLQLFISFFKIGLFGFGGGYAILSLIQHEILSHDWITQAELTDIIAISQMTPGPIGINSATYVGYVATGSVWGAVVATIAIVLPSFAIMLTLSKFMLAVRDNKYMEYALSALRPTVVGLIAAAALLLVNKENFIDYKSVILFVAAFILSFKFKLHPILLIILAGVAGLLLY
ncbi:chromate transporter [Paludibacter sp. 221]|uniref:chromate transporter n=1 Tax=Paludibacter sp. 221 TaxID=2302939 RepID=UPI0013D842EE|nr:chromate transporter [Paludibacter sp. 221]NDV47367.1 chromate transporter [Paludibacter sp. 221]